MKNKELYSLSFIINLNLSTQCAESGDALGGHINKMSLM